MQAKTDADDSMETGGRDPPNIFWRVGAALMYIIPWIDVIALGREVYHQFPNSIVLFLTPGMSCALHACYRCCSFCTDLLLCNFKADCVICRAVCWHLLQQSICPSSGLLPPVLVCGEKHQAPSLCPLQCNAGNFIAQYSSGKA